MKAMAEQFGGTLLAVYWPASPDWDFILLAELPEPDDAYALMSFSSATGLFVRCEATPLFTSAEADAPIARQLNWTPGS